MDKTFKTFRIFNPQSIPSKTILTISMATQLYMKLPGKGLAPAWVCCATTRPTCT